MANGVSLTMMIVCVFLSRDEALTFKVLSLEKIFFHFADMNDDGRFYVRVVDWKLISIQEVQIPIIIKFTRPRMIELFKEQETMRQ